MRYVVIADLVRVRTVSSRGRAHLVEVRRGELAPAGIYAEDAAQFVAAGALRAIRDEDTAGRSFVRDDSALQRAYIEAHRPAPRADG